MENVVENEYANKVTLARISNDINDESCNINGISSMLFCMSDNVSELNCDAMCTLASCLYDIHKRLDALSNAVMDFSKQNPQI